MTVTTVSSAPASRIERRRYFRLLKTWQLVTLFVLFMVFTILLSVRIMRLEIHAATQRLISHSAGASRNLEMQFD